jgi:hypothetical protein
MFILCKFFYCSQILSLLLKVIFEFRYLDLLEFQEYSPNLSLYPIFFSLNNHPTSPFFPNFFLE